MIPFMNADIREMTVSELSRYIFQEIKKVSLADKRDSVWRSSIIFKLDFVQIG